MSHSSSSPEPDSARTSHRAMVVGLLLTLVLTGAVLLLVKFLRTEPEPDSLNVPLGVEQAAIVTYSGPPVTVTPYKWGVAVNVRIARVIEQPGTHVYDVRYIVNRAGTFDLKDYLVGEDGSILAGLPSFKFHGDPKLSKELDARIQETEDLTIEVGGHYRAVLTGLAVFWIVWLLLLIFWRRSRKVESVEVAAPPPTFAEVLQGFLNRLQQGKVDAAEKARMEMLLLRHWREELGLSGLSMSAALAAVQRDEKTGRLLRRVQDWLHRSVPNSRDEEIAALLSPYAAAASGAAKPATDSPS